MRNTNEAAATQQQWQGYGALPFPQVTPALRGLIRTGRVFSLQHIMRSTMPQWTAHPAYALTNVMSHEDSVEIMRPPVTGSFERIEHSGHSGTHIDALCHVGCLHGGAVQLHGGQTAREIWTPEGYRALGAEHFPPIIVRGVLLDIPAALGCDRLPDLYEITVADLQEAERRQGVAIERDTAVLIRTGFEGLWESEPDHYQLQSPGPSLDAVHYLAEQGGVVTGTDTANYEVVAFPDLPIHMFLIYERGIPIIENLRLNELAASRTYEFLFVALPIAFAGASGSSLHPIAIA